MSNISFLIDTNIFIPLEPTKTGYTNTETAAEFHKLIQESGNHILIHPIIDKEFDNDKDEKRRTIRKSLKMKYTILDNPPSEEILPVSIRSKGKPGTHTWIDNHFLAAIFDNCVHYLVTEDQQIHKHALMLGIQDKILYLTEAVDFLKSRMGDNPVISSHVELLHPREINIEEPFFDSLREDYPEFTEWFNSKVKPDQSRSALLIRSEESIAAIAIMKKENGVEYGPNGNTLKICTFKVMPQFGQQRIGELLLKSILKYCHSKKFEYTYLSTFEKQGALISFLGNFGFMETARKNDRGELIFYKKLIPSLNEIREMSSWEFNLKFGPYTYNCKDANSFVIPIQPDYHDTLFPELATQMTLFSDKACGNSMRKSYICHATTKQVNIGDMLYFYRSKVSDIRVVGIVEGVFRSANPDDIIAFVGNRTVYTENKIKEWCTKEALVINFREVLLSKHSINGKSYFPSAPRSVNQIKSETASEILHTLEQN